jgi:hypothetical protein
MLKRAIVIASLMAAAGLGQSSPVTTGQLAVNIGPEATLAWQGDTLVMVKARLAPGTQARIWADDNCGLPAAGARVIVASGMIAIDLANLDAAGKRLVCLLSSDGRLSATLPAVR